MAFPRMHAVLLFNVKYFFIVCRENLSSGCSCAGIKILKVAYLNVVSYKRNVMGIKKVMTK